MRIAVYAFDGITMFHLATPLTVFGEVSRLGIAAWESTVWSRDGGAIRTSEGLDLGTVEGPEAAASADVLVIPSWPSTLPATDDALITIIRHAHARGAMVVGLCLGTFAVADSGLLDGRSAVTHWVEAERLARRHRDVVVDPSALYIDHGDVLTSAGTASALDACLHVVRVRLGSAAATAVARRLVIAPHREGGQAQYIEHPIPDGHDIAIGEVTGWAMAHLDQPLTVGDLADRAHVSSRTLTRRFRDVAGTSPARWLLARRLDEARRLLETSDLPVARVADACGFASPVTFRQNFVSAYATTPTAYRRQFQERTTPA